MNEPTVEQLAALSATLNRDCRLSPQDAAKLALEHWCAAAEALEEPHGLELVARAFAEQRRVREAREHLSEMPHQPFREPSGYPIKFDQAVRLWLPNLNGKTANRAALFRRYLTATLPGGESKDVVDSEFARLRAEPLDRALFFSRGSEFQAWYSTAYPNEISEARRNAARARHKGATEKNQRKPIDT
jgi:hypothetical protein